MADKTVKKAVVIGAGLGGISAAGYLSRAGYQVDIYEQAASIGGRYRMQQLAGFEFSLDNSWYWLPEIWQDMARDFAIPQLNFQTSHPNYRVFWDQAEVDVGGRADARELFSHMEPGAGIELDKLLVKAGKSYEQILESEKHGFGIWRRLVGVMEGSYAKLCKQFVHDQRLKDLLDFKLLFLGTDDKQADTAQNFMNWIDFGLGLPQPEQGWQDVHKFLAQILKQQGLKLHLGQTVTGVSVKNSRITGIKLGKKSVKANLVVAAGSYQAMEKLLPATSRQFQTEDLRQMKFAPRSMLWAFVLDEPANNLKQRNIFLDGDREDFVRMLAGSNAAKWPEQPFFIADKISGESQDLLLITVPLACSLADDPAEEERLKCQILERISDRLQFDVDKHIVESAQYQLDSLGLAHSRRQQIFGRLPAKSAKVEGLFFAGADTWPGLLPSQQIISGRRVADQIGQN